MYLTPGPQLRSTSTFCDVYRPVVGTHVQVDFVLPFLLRIDLTYVIITDDGSTDFGGLHFG